MFGFFFVRTSWSFLLRSFRYCNLFSSTFLLVLLVLFLRMDTTNQKEVWQVRAGNVSRCWSRPSLFCFCFVFEVLAPRFPNLDQQSFLKTIVIPLLVLCDNSNFQLPSFKKINKAQTGFSSALLELY